MHINHLKYFISVAENRSFTRAAEIHYVTQTAITQQIQAMEEQLECTLIDRSTRPISLTPAGKTFLEEAKAIVERMGQAVLRTKEASIGMVGALRIGYIKGYERSDLSEKLRCFHHLFPNVLLTVYRNSSDILTTGLLEDRYDMIITWDESNLRKEPEMASVLIEKAHLAVAMYPSHPLAARMKLSRKDLKNEQILYMSPSETGDSFGDAHFLELYQKAGYQPNILLRSTDIESILMMVAAEEGISILPDYCTSKLENADNLVFIPLEGEEEHEEIHGIWKRAHGNPALNHFVEIL